MQETIIDGRLKSVRAGLLITALAGLLPIIAVIIVILSLATSVATFSSITTGWLPTTVVLITPSLMFVGSLLIFRGILTPEVRKTIKPCCVLSVLIVVSYLITPDKPIGTTDFALILLPFAVGVIQIVAFLRCAKALFVMSDISGMNRVYNSCVYMLISLALIAVGYLSTFMAQSNFGSILTALGDCSLFSGSIFWCIGWIQAWHSAKTPINIDTDPEVED